jgi:hypothetical protein
MSIESAARQAREAFEVWASTIGITDMWLETDDLGEYTFARTKDAWLGWRAALSQQAAAPEAPTDEAKDAALRELIDLCAIGDVDETTEALGWGEAIRRAKAALAT